ncbi:Triacylglycerol lipase [Bertholletia excelsa]
MESLQQRVETWIRDQRTKILNVTWPPQWRMVVRWPWNNGREQRKRIQQEYERRKKQLHDLCSAVKAESVPDLQDILCCMVLSECVYKRPASEMLRAVNKFKADFGGQVVSLERVQPSSDHVPHRYLLAEAGDTLFASFIGTKQYKDVMADANILQGAIFHEDDLEDNYGTATAEHALEAKPSQPKSIHKPAVHRGFMARAKGIPALELYRLAQKKKRKLVLCGHSLGGAVAALATLAILRVIAASSSSKDYDKVQVKCITFSQPPVGNAALKDYVNRKGWQHHFKTYCIPEDLVPRILSPAYFHHYNAQALARRVKKLKTEKSKESEEEQLVLGLGPIQTSFWRLSRLVPLEGVRRKFNQYKGRKVDPAETAVAESAQRPSFDDLETTPPSLEIQEGSDGISLKPLSEIEKTLQGEEKDGKSSGKSNSNSRNNHSAWRRVPYLPSYVPFGQLYILGNSSVESLSGAEYSKLTSVKSVIAEVRERFQSHSMKSYRARFLRIYELCMNGDASLFLGVEQMQQFPHLQKWLGISVARAVEFGHIVESPVVRTATSVVPLGWSGVPGDKNGDPLKVDIIGFGLHLCTLVQARVNGHWCSTTVESFPSSPLHSSDGRLKTNIQKMRVLVGPPLRRQPKQQMEADTLAPLFPSIESNSVDSKMKDGCAFHREAFICPEDLSDFVICCTSDFSTVSKEVHVRTRRVRLVGLEGAGKTSLLKAIFGEGRLAATTNVETLHMDFDAQEVISGGLCYSDSAGINLQDLQMEVSRFRDELWKGIHELSEKTDLIVLVHNLSHRIPRRNHSNSSEQQPALSLLLNEAKALRIPWVLAITNKFSVSAHQQKAAIDAVLQAYQASPSTTEVINSCPYVMPSAASASLSLGAANTNSDGGVGPQNLMLAPINLLWRPFQRKAVVLPVEGITDLRQLVHRVLRSQEDAAMQELARDALALELARERALTATRESQVKANSLTAATVGASLGAGLGIVLAVVMGAGSALRKP